MWTIFIQESPLCMGWLSPPIEDGELGNQVGTLPLHLYLKNSVESLKPVSFHQVAIKSRDECKHHLCLNIYVDCVYGRPDAICSAVRNLMVILSQVFNF